MMLVLKEDFVLDLFQEQQFRPVWLYYVCSCFCVLRFMYSVNLYFGAYSDRRLRLSSAVILFQEAMEMQGGVSLEALLCARDLLLICLICSPQARTVGYWKRMILMIIIGEEI
jgi:hypothetical protein